MKTIALFSLSLMLWISCYSQIGFENGYFISNDGTKTECLIKNTGWKNNPREFSYKIAKESSIQKAFIKDVSEFEILNQLKYKRFDIEIDQSSEDMEMLSITEAPDFKKEQVFLKVLVEGKASLYAYESKRLTKYFISTDSLQTEQLIFKSYQASPGRIGENNTFKNQLWNNLQCATIEKSAIEKMRYTHDELTGLFSAYNSCKGTPFVNYEKKQKRDLLNLSIRAGINSSRLIAMSPTYTQKNNLGNKVNLRLGIEAEFIFKSNKNKWAFIIEPAFQKYKTEGVINGNSAYVDYKSIELLLGFRHFLHMSEDSKFFLSAGIINDFSLGSSFKVGRDTDLKIKSPLNISFGAGLRVKNKVGVEVKYMMSRELLGGYVAGWDSDYKTVSFIVSYTIF